MEDGLAQLDPGLDIVRVVVDDRSELGFGLVDPTAAPKTKRIQEGPIARRQVPGEFVRPVGRRPHVVRVGPVLDQLGRPEEAEASFASFLEIWGESDSTVAEVDSARKRLAQERPD